MPSSPLLAWQFGDLSLQTLSLLASLAPFSSGFLITYLLALSLVSNLSATLEVRSLPSMSKYSSHKRPHLWAYFCVQGLNTTISVGMAPPSSHPALNPLLSCYIRSICKLSPGQFYLIQLILGSAIPPLKPTLQTCSPLSVFPISEKRIINLSHPLRPPHYSHLRLSKLLNHDGQHADSFPQAQRKQQCRDDAQASVTVGSFPHLSSPSYCRYVSLCPHTWPKSLY